MLFILKPCTDKITYSLGLKQTMQSLLDIKDFTCMLDSVSHLLLLRDALLSADIFQTAGTLPNQAFAGPLRDSAAASMSHSSFSMTTCAGEVPSAQQDLTAAVSFHGAVYACKVLALESLSRHC